jgi:hypothetical protein
MAHHRRFNLVGVAPLLIALASCVQFSTPAHAAVLSGTFDGGPGAAACSASVTCETYTTQCAIPADNNVDASVATVPGALLGKTVPLTWSTAASEGAGLVVVFFSACQSQISQTAVLTNASIAVPGNATTVAIFGRFPNIATAWSLG